MAEKNSVRCVIIAGSPDADADFMANFLKADDYIICADGGYKYANQLNIVPNLIVGDFDSYNGVLPDTEVVTLQVHKDDTDTAHCAKIAIDRGFKQVVILGALGGRSDHCFANYCVLQYLNENGVEGIIIDKDSSVEFRDVGIYDYKNLKGKTFSVFPFACNEAVVSYLGDCQYPANNLILKSSLAMGISNIFRSDFVQIKVSEGKVIIFIEKL